MDGLTCRHCGRPIAVPASKCPWCGEQIMAICANCKAYTDDSKPVCDQCRAPLQADSMEKIKMLARQPDVGRLAKDKEQAQLVASALVINNLGDFFFDDGQGQRTVLAELLGSPRDRTVAAAGVLFAAYAYVNQKGYCSLRVIGGDSAGRPERVALSQMRAWDGQQSIEGAITEQGARVATTAEATEKAVRELMGFRKTMVQSRALSLGKMVDASTRSPLAAIDQAARLAVLPDHDRREACRATYQMLVSFVSADRARARALALENLRQTGGFARYESDSSIGLGQ